VGGKNFEPGTTLEPGASTQLSAKINVRGRRGGQEKSITISSNDLARPQYVLKMKGTITAEVDLLPNRVDFLDMKENQAADREVKVVCNVAKPFHVTKVETNGAFITAKLVTIEEGKSYSVKISSVPPLPSGISRANVTVTTDHPQYPTLIIPVSVQLPSDVIAAPPMLAVSSEQKDGAAPAPLFAVVRSRTNQPFKLLKVEPPFPEIKATITPLDASSYKIEVTNYLPVERLNGRLLRIFTDNPSSKEIRLPFQVINKRAPMPSVIKPMMSIAPGPRQQGSQPPSPPPPQQILPVPVQPVPPPPAPAPPPRQP
jgi:hypothetical protein